MDNVVNEEELRLHEGHDEDFDDDEAMMDENHPMWRSERITLNSVGIDINLQGLQPPPPPPPAPPPAPMPDPGMMPPGLLPLPAGMPEQKDIETAASVMEKALAIVLDDDVSHEAIRAASVRDGISRGSIV